MQLLPMSEDATITPDDFVIQLKKNLQFRSVFEQILFQQIVDRVAEDRSLTITPDEIQAEADQFRATRRLERAADTYRWLEEERITAEEWETGIRDRLLTNKVKEALFGAEVERIFTENRVNFDQAVIYQTVVPYGQLAQELFYQIEEREISFFEAAHLYDIDAKRRHHCGFEGKLYRWSLHPEMAAVVFGASSGELLRPLQMGEHHHLILVEELIMAELSDEIQSEILDQLFQEWLRDELKDVIS
ncbi:peptidylprolyl isomerase [Leptolyngbya sp. NIES-2104]|uniref:peptidylprolyl isomerase n=1 Tax=Leptolyngbya sp. NIES-2104 TaxID=1552121 RepID=UPI0006EC8F2D|nr:peptidylprolyl isomerase [Leptolyngbya sp. NIES-2104]GAP99361.1 parvulin-like peptidyl-prolyl isomerase [Leptolyngbya sp. NIES-2104]